MGPPRHLAEWRSSSSWADRPAGSDTRAWRGAQVPTQETAWMRQTVSTGQKNIKPTLLGALRPWDPSKHAAVSAFIHVCAHLHPKPNDLS